MTGTRLDFPAVALLRDAAEWRLLGLLLERPRGRWWDEVAQLATTCADAMLGEAAGHAARATESAYLEWLGPGGCVSPRESGHRASTDPGHLLAELGAFYDAFQYRAQTEEPPDHASVEAGFMAYLCLKEAHALAQGDTAAAEVTAEAAARFRQEHVAAMAESLAQALSPAPPYLSSSAAVLLRRVGPRPPSLEGGWAPHGLDAACLSCGDLGEGDPLVD